MATCCSLNSNTSENFESSENVSPSVKLDELIEKLTGRAKTPCPPVPTPMAAYLIRLVSIADLK